VRIRFRIGSDEAASEFGSEIDDVKLSGIVGTPFPAVVKDAGTCNGSPVADAGKDQIVGMGDVVQLDASGSSDPEGDALSFSRGSRPPDPRRR
jgi:hypothetical protein